MFWIHSQMDSFKHNSQACSPTVPGDDFSVRVIGLHSDRLLVGDAGRDASAVGQARAEQV
jgi:hypothetical protein